MAEYEVQQRGEDASDPENFTAVKPAKKPAKKA